MEQQQYNIYIKKAEECFKCQFSSKKLNLIQDWHLNEVNQIRVWAWTNVEQNCLKLEMQSIEDK